jgi:hypothetical protein
VDFAVTIAAVNWLITVWLKRDFGTFTALGTGRREHLARGSVTTVGVTLQFPGPAAIRTALRLVGVAFRTEKLLVFSAESESNSAIGALNGLVLKTHLMTFSLNYLVRARVIQIIDIKRSVL